MSASVATQISYPVMESFYTLQGEGFHQGHAAYFIRLGGCDVGCVWCDVKDSWNAANHPLFTVDAILQQMRQELSAAGETDVTTPTSKPIVVITGGEPLMHPLGPLTNALQAAGYRTHIETSGAHPMTGSWDWICLSPKKFKAPLPEIMPLANELKVVVYNKTDFQWAEQYAALVSPACKLYLQPEWEKAATVTPLMIDYIKAHPQWELSLQLHKYIHVP